MTDDRILELAVLHRIGSTSDNPEDPPGAIFPAFTEESDIRDLVLQFAQAIIAEATPVTPIEIVAYYNDNWTLTPKAYDEARAKDPYAFDDMKPAFAVRAMAT